MAIFGLIYYRMQKDRNQPIKSHECEKLPFNFNYLKFFKS